MLLGAIPKIIEFLVILAVGWIIAALVATAVGTLLRAVQFNNLAQRSGFADLVHNMGVKTAAAGFLALVTKWFILLICWSPLLTHLDFRWFPACCNNCSYGC